MEANGGPALENADSAVDEIDQDGMRWDVGDLKLETKRLQLAVVTNVLQNKISLYLLLDSLPG